MVAEAEGLNAIGEKCRRNQMSLCYHNHWWEIEDLGRVLAEIAKRTIPELVSFCPDIGWIRKVTVSFIELLRIIESRNRLVHFKDYVADGLEEKDNETELGQGIMDFHEAFQFLRGLEFDELWIVAEQWKSTVNHLSPEESIQRSFAYLKQFKDQ